MSEDSLICARSCVQKDGSILAKDVHCTENNNRLMKSAHVMYKRVDGFESVPYEDCVDEIQEALSAGDAWTHVTVVRNPGPGFHMVQLHDSCEKSRSTCSGTMDMQLDHHSTVAIMRQLVNLLQQTLPAMRQKARNRSKRQRVTMSAS
jgi:hypothetical protein